MSVDEMLKVADFVSIHVPLTPDTKDLFNAKSIAEMKDDAVVLNMSRGGIVNEKDMYEALKAGKIGGYAADVMENELAGSGRQVMIHSQARCSSVITSSFPRTRCSVRRCFQRHRTSHHFQGKEALSL